MAWGFIVFADNKHQRMRTHPHMKMHPPGSVLHPPAPRDAPTGPSSAPTWLGYAPTPGPVSIVTTFGPIERHSGYKDFRPCWEVPGVAFFLLVEGVFWGVGVGRAELWNGSQLRLIGPSERPLRGSLGASRQEALKSMGLASKGMRLASKGTTMYCGRSLPRRH